MFNTLTDFIVRFILFTLIGTALMGPQPLSVAVFALACSGLALLFDSLYGSSRAPKKQSKRLQRLIAGNTYTIKDKLAWMVLAFSAPVAVLFVTALVLSLFAGREQSWVWVVAGVLASIAAWLLIILAPRLTQPFHNKQ
jgi:hypothetical protein